MSKKSWDTRFLGHSGPESRKLAQTVQDNLDGPKWLKNLAFLHRPLNSVSNFFGTPCRLTSSSFIRKWTPRVDRRGLACCRRRKEIFPLLFIIVLFSTFYCRGTEKNKLSRQEIYVSSNKYVYSILYLGVHSASNLTNSSGFLEQRRKYKHI